MSRGVISFMEKNVHGAWVIYGAYDTKQYYGYSKREAARRYRASCDVVTERKKI